MSPRPRAAAPASARPSFRIIAILIGTAVFVFAFQWLFGIWWTLGVFGGVLLVVGLTTLLVAKTSFGRRAGAAVWRPIGRTRIGRRIARRQLRWAAKARGISLTDPTGRPLSDIELQLELVDTPEVREIKRQLKGMNPRQRAQALRMMQAQADEVARTGIPPVPVKPPTPRQRYGRPR